MENVAYYQAWIFSWVFYLIILICSALQYVTFCLYTERYHPMARILEEYKREGTLYTVYHVTAGNNQVTPRFTY